MKKTFLLIPLLLVLCINICNSQYVLTKENNLIRGGDCIVKQQVEYVNPGESGENKSWDFSGINVIKDKYLLVYRSYNDTLYTGMEHRTLYGYQFLNDTLYNTGYENPLVILNDSIAQVSIVYPLTYGQKINKDFYFKGKYSSNKTMESIGQTNIHADSYGTLILPDADTIENVLRVCIRNISNIKIYDRKNGLTADTVNVDPMPVHKEEIFRWYAEGYRYPLFETISHMYYKDNKLLSSFGTAFYYSMVMQQENINDSVNARIREKNILITDGKPNSRSINNCNSSEHDLIYVQEELEPEAGNASLSLTIFQDNITIGYNFPKRSHIEIILTDMQGRVFYYAPKRSIENGGYDVAISRDNMMPGDYILCFVINGESQNRRFTLK